MARHKTFGKATISNGPRPWDEADYHNWFSKKRSSKNKVAYNEEMDLKSKGIDTRQLRSFLTGDTYTLPRLDYEQLVKYYNEHHSELSQKYADSSHTVRSVETPADLIDYAFGDKQKKNIVTQECQGGHIATITYNPLYQTLMVKFTNNGNICVFFMLPANVASTLMYHAMNNTMAPPDKHGRPRHMVGVEFWNLVRVRGTIHDTRYPFEYVQRFVNGVPFSDTAGTPGRRPGSGVHGEGNKYIYEKADAQRKRYDEDGQEIIRQVTVRTPVNNLAKMEDDTSNVYDKIWDMEGVAIEDVLTDYFENNSKGYNYDVGHLKGDRLKTIRTAFDTFNSGNYVYEPNGKNIDIHDLATQLLQAGANLKI